MADITPEQIRTWADQYLKGIISPEDKARFEAWYNSMPKDGTAAWPVDDAHDAESLKRMMLKTIQQKAGAGRHASKVRTMTRLRRAAAAAVILLAVGAGMYFMASRHRPAGETISLTRQDIPPGGNKATLTLANGAVMVLDSMADGTLTRQGNTVITKSSGGQLVYSSTGDDNHAGAVPYNTLATPRGGQYRLMLPDGTKVWLDAQSSVSYPVAFTGPQRGVKVTGEVYFEVAENADKPFTINVNDRARIRVLGTHFNIMAYPDEKLLTTTLLEGRISIAAAGDASAAEILSPGDQAAIAPNGKITKRENADAEKAVAWKNNYFAFHNSSLQEAMRQLARWYDIEVVYEGSVNTLLNGRFKRSNNLSAALKIIQTAANVKFRIEGRKIIVGK